MNPPKAVSEKLKLTTGRAMAEYAEVRSWTCETCDLMVDEGERHCRHCGPYWRDVAAGLFDCDDWDQAGKSALEQGT